MTPTGCTEDALIEQPAIAMLCKLGWKTVNAFQEFVKEEIRWVAKPRLRSSSPHILVMSRLEAGLSS
ncbi:MAG: hypothetical protein HQM08_19165 [Candidatus Riflebacteria bacterium]|nr:hypothetical protein [Candidatus Riflebacteria bacterium]